MSIIDLPSSHGFARSGDPDMIIVHCMGEYIDLYDDPVPDPHAESFLHMIGLSAHALVCPNGDIISCRDDVEGAYHAKGFNSTSLGIEFLVEGTHTIATLADTIIGPYLKNDQYDAGLEYVRDWIQEYDIPRERVLRHSDVSPGRKIDPGAGFPWDAFLNSCYGRRGR